jgi:N-acetylneuraminic acid mutarotase
MYAYKDKTRRVYARIFQWLLVVLLVLPYIGVQINAGAELPPKMLGQKMIYDPVGKRIILFGGSFYSSSYTFYGDTWSFDTAKNDWSKLATNGSPSARFNHAMVYDSDRKEIVLFGGFSASDRIGDTWIYNVATNTWTNVSPQTSPSRRSDPGAAYDAKAKKVVIFGGYGLGDKIQGDTWVFDVELKTWTQMAPDNKPTGRYGGIMVYDSYTEKCLLFGGHLIDASGKDFGYENEIWAYDYAVDNWEMLPTQNKPPARYWHDLAYDPDGNRIILFSGSQGGGNDLGDTWIFSCRDKTWTKVTSTENPVARTQPSLAYDTSSKKTVMFGGADFVVAGNFVYYNDVWALDQNNQWAKLVAGGQTITPTQPASEVPGFQSVEVVAGLALSTVILLLVRRRYPQEKKI